MLAHTCPNTIHHLSRLEATGLWQPMASPNDAKVIRIGAFENPMVFHKAHFLEYCKRPRVMLLEEHRPTWTFAKSWVHTSGKIL